MANVALLCVGDVLLVGGYKGHGKDTFFEFLAGTRRDVQFEIKSNDAVCTLPKVAYTRYAFADALKEKVAKLLNVTVSYIDKHKDMPIAEDIVYTPHNSNAVIKTIRDVLIDYATHKRKNNPYYFAALVQKQIEQSGDSIVVVTDFRFVEEYVYLLTTLSSRRRIFTARVNRTGAPIPAKDEVSEHKLNDFKFHFMIKNI